MLADTAGWIVTEWTVAVAATITALGVIWRKVLRPAVSGLRDMQESVAYIRREMEFNGGRTARDAIGRLEEGQQEQSARLGRVEDHLGLQPWPEGT